MVVSIRYLLREGGLYNRAWEGLHYQALYKQLG